MDGQRANARGRLDGSRMDILRSGNEFSLAKLLKFFDNIMLLYIKNTFESVCCASDMKLGDLSVANMKSTIVSSVEDCFLKTLLHPKFLHLLLMR